MMGSPTLPRLGYEFAHEVNEDVEILQALASQPGRRRSALLVTIECDPLPGWGHDPRDHQHLVEALLKETVPHYNPRVTPLDEARRRLYGDVL